MAQHSSASSHHSIPLLNKDQKNYEEDAVFQPENLLRESRRQNSIKECPVPEICVLDPDGDFVDWLIESKKATKNRCWACYHSSLYSFQLHLGSKEEGTNLDIKIGVIPCAVGAPYAVLVAEQLFVSGCHLLISITSAGIINEDLVTQKFALITEAVRDEGTSYHYLPPHKKSRIPDNVLELLTLEENEDAAGELYFKGKSWTTDAPYRETKSAINAMKKQKVVCVEMEAAALYAFAKKKQQDVACFAHLTNSMAQDEGDFEKGEAFGSLEMLDLITQCVKKLNEG